LATELRHGIANLLRDPGLRQKLVRNARGALDQHRGATTPTAALINELLSADGFSEFPICLA
jgi:hypothetical protein